MSETQFERLLKRVNELERENERLREDKKRLRGLLKECVPYINSPYPRLLRDQLIDRIGKEVDDD